MPLVSTRTLILQTFPYSDTSKILRLFTLDHGLRSAIAKGALRPKSRFGGVLEPFAEGDALLYLKEGRDLHTLSGFDLLHSRQSLGRDLVAFAGASLIAELLLRFATEEPNHALYRMARRSFDAIAEARHPEQAQSAILSAAWLAISLLGYRPELDRCVTCGRALDASESVRFNVEAGGIACAPCRPRGRVVGSESRSELQRMVQGRALDGPLSRVSLQHDLLRAFVASHLAHDRPLRSLELFTQCSA